MHNNFQMECKTEPAAHQMNSIRRRGVKLSTLRLPIGGMQASKANLVFQSRAASRLNEKTKFHMSLLNIILLTGPQGWHTGSTAAGFEPAREIPADFESASLTTRTRRLDATPAVPIRWKSTVLFFSSFLSSSVDHFRLSPSSCLNHIPLHYVRRLASISFLSILPHRAHPFVPLFRTTHIHSMHVFLINALIMMPVYVEITI